VIPMVSLKKYIPCKCGANNSFEFNSDMNIEDLTLSARCPSCGASVTISVSALLSQQPAQAAAAPTPSPESFPPVELTDQETKENVEQAVRDIFRY
jgi:hypothetical protein